MATDAFRAARKRAKKTQIKHAVIRERKGTHTVGAAPSPGRPTPRRTPAQPQPTTTATQPYDASKPTYRTNADFDAAVNSTAQTQIQPQLDDVAAQQRNEDAAHKGRMSELASWYGNYAGQSQGAYNQASDALNRMAASQAQGGQAAQDALAQALQGQAQTQAGLVKSLGGQSADTGQNAALLAGTTENQAALNAALGMSANAGLGKMAGDINTVGLQGLQDAKDEQARNRTANSQIAATRTDLANRIPDLRTASRSQLQELEIAKRTLGEQVANQNFQEYLSEQQLGLSKKQETFNEWLQGQQLTVQKRSQAETERQGASQRTMANKNYQLDAARVAAEIRGTKDKGNSDEAKARGERMRNGATMLNQYLAPTDAELIKTKDENGTTRTKVSSSYASRLSFDEALQMLRTQAGMGPIDSLRMLVNSLPKGQPFDRWRQRGQRILTQHLLSSGKNTGSTSVTPGHPHG